jgi:hypothetical protein
VQSDRSISDCWFLQGTKAKVVCGTIQAEIDVEWPTRGLNNLRLSNEALDGWLMAIDAANADVVGESSDPWRPTDVYARGSDLVVTYRERLGQAFQLQVYWRVLARRGVESSALEAIVSIQTREWEAYPAITLNSALDASRADLHHGGVRFLSRADWGYVEASAEGDFEPAIVALPSGLRQAAWRYGKRFMERGVIRRLRLRGAIVTAENTGDSIEQLKADLAAEPPPLTA